MQSTNAVCNVFITHYLSPDFVSYHHDHLQGTLQEYKKNKQSVKMYKWTTKKMFCTFYSYWISALLLLQSDKIQLLKNT